MLDAEVSDMKSLMEDLLQKKSWNSKVMCPVVKVPGVQVTTTKPLWTSWTRCNPIVDVEDREASSLSFAVSVLEGLRKRSAKCRRLRMLLTKLTFASQVDFRWNPKLVDVESLPRSAGEPLIEYQC